MNGLKLKYILPPHLQKKVKLSVLFFYLFIIFSVTAIINPKWGTTYAAQDYKRGVDIVFAFDVSRSMDIKDVQIGGTSASRLERGRYLAKESALAVPGARFAAALGRSRGYLSVPLTFDNEAVIRFMENLDTSAMTGRSTNLQSLIEAAVESFQTTSAARKVILLISDGESHFGNVRSALNQCIREGIIIIACGIGSDEGAPVPGISGEPIPVSARDSSALRMAAERTGGIYIDGNREDAASVLKTQLTSLAQDLPFTDGSPHPERKTEPKQRRSLFVVLAIIAYGTSVIIPRLSKNKHSNRIAASLAAFVLLLSSCTEGKLLLIEANYLFSRGRYDEALVPYSKALEHEDAAAYAEYGLGLTYYSMDINSNAMNHYINSMQRIKDESEHRELQYRNIYNMGIVSFDQGNYETAAVYFKEALKIDPAKIDAKRNLEISLMSITKDTKKEQQPQMHNEAKEVMFQYARQQEQPNWKSGEWQAEEVFTGPDY